MKFLFLSFLLVIGVVNVKSSNLNTEAENSQNALNTTELTVYSAPSGVTQNTTYSVFVKTTNSPTWIDLFEYDAIVDAGYTLPSNPKHMTYVSFDSDFSTHIDIKIVKNSGSFGQVKVRPDIAGITPTMVDASTLTFSMTKAQKISVEVDGSLYDNIMIFGNENEAKTYTGDVGNVKYYGPGVHNIGDGTGTLYLNANDTIYIAGGAILYGNIVAGNYNNPSSNVAILGRGIISMDKFTNHNIADQNRQDFITFLRCSNSSIEGVTLLNTVKWNIRLNFCSDITCKNLKIMSWTCNSDGIDPVASSNVLIDDCFIRDWDDCISVKGSYAPSANPLAKDVDNIVVQNCILWTDQGRAIAIGPEFYSAENKIFQNYTFKNIDILYNENYGVSWAKGALSILLGDGATLRNVLFEDIRVDKLGAGTNLINVAITATDYSAIGLKIENITFNNVYLKSYLPIVNTIYSNDSSKIIDGVHFNNLKIGNAILKYGAGCYFNIDPNVQNIYFNNVGY